MACQAAYQTAYLPVVGRVSRQAVIPRRLVEGKGMAACLLEARCPCVEVERVAFRQGLEAYHQGKAACSGACLVL